MRGFNTRLKAIEAQLAGQSGGLPEGWEADSSGINFGVGVNEPNEGWHSAVGAFGIALWHDDGYYTNLKRNRLEMSPPVGELAGPVFDVSSYDENNSRFRMNGSGKMQWGDGDAALDISLERTGEGQVTLNGILDAAGLQVNGEDVSSNAPTDIATLDTLGLSAGWTAIPADWGAPPAYIYKQAGRVYVGGWLTPDNAGTSEVLADIPEAYLPNTMGFADSDTGFMVPVRFASGDGRGYAHMTPSSPGAWRLMVVNDFGNKPLQDVCIDGLSWPAAT